jgi:hypothetical protein
MYGIYQVRKSIIRISFQWKSRDPELSELPDKDKYIDVVIPGIILSKVKSVFCSVIADATFFVQEKPETKSFQYYFPKSDGGYKKSRFRPRITPTDDGFCLLEFKKDYDDKVIQPIQFETSPVKVGEHVYSFVFPRESYITKTGYSPGTVM